MEAIKLGAPLRDPASPELVSEASHDGTRMMSSSLPSSSKEASPAPAQRHGDDDIDELMLSPDTQGTIRRLSSQADAILDSILETSLPTPPLATKSNDDTKKESLYQQQAADIQVHDDYDDDDEMSHEMHRLDHVAESLRQDLDQENVDTMKDTLQSLRTPLTMRYKYNKETVLLPSPSHNNKKKKEEQWDWIVVVMVPVLILVAFRILVGPSHGVLFGY